MPRPKSHFKQPPYYLVDSRKIPNMPFDPLKPWAIIAPGYKVHSVYRTRSGAEETLERLNREAAS